MADGKHELSNLADVGNFFNQEISAKLKSVGLTDIDKVDQFVGWLFSCDSLAELGIKKSLVRRLEEADIETVGEMVVRITKRGKLSKFIR